MALVFCPASTRAAPETKFDFLMRFYDLNEGAFAYHRHCLSTKGAINPAFLRTLDLVANELLAVSIEYNPGMDPEYIKTQILERRYKIQYGLDRANMNEGCYSEAALKAKEHYEEFGRYEQSVIQEYIREETVE